MRPHRRKLQVVVVIIFLVSSYLAAMIPDSAPSVMTNGGGKPFAWNQDRYWDSLEAQFVFRRRLGCDNRAEEVSQTLASASAQIHALGREPISSKSESLRKLERTLFQAAVGMSACRSAMKKNSVRIWQLRNEIKQTSLDWNMNKEDERQVLYRLLYGSRIALEQAMLVSGTFSEIPSRQSRDIDSPVVPTAVVHGVSIHSGDILLSRGTAPTSALIARGNDFPGNFSHVALVHVSETHQVSIIESHIEGGVAVTDVEGYLRDKKFRILVLRLRSDVPEIQKDPALPHKAASAALIRARRNHIPYDFEMDYQHSDKLFCSEVVSSAYLEQGITLWNALSHISNPVVVRWMRDFGVRHFITQAPSDLEYDSQLRIVYEWRSRAGLIYDTVDNAVVDAMIDTADANASLPYNPWMLPVARLVKLYSALMSRMGRKGPIPEGMTPTAALRNQAFQAGHFRLTKQVLVRAEQFQKKHRYFPPYWRLVRMAKAEIEISAQAE